MGYSKKDRGIFKIISYVVEGLFANRKIGGVSFRKEHRERGFLIKKEEGQGLRAKTPFFLLSPAQNKGGGGKGAGGPGHGGGRG